MQSQQSPHIPFLEQVARHYLDEGLLEERVFIFPSKRAQKFFLHYLEQIALERGLTIFAPETTTVNDFILAQKPQLQLLDKTELLFRLYDCRVASQAYQGEEPERDIEDFLFWGNIILSDFDLIDRNLVDAYQLYRNIAGLKELDDIHLDFLDDDTKAYLARYFRGFVDNSQMSEEERESYRARFLAFWESLYDLYLDFRASLESSGAPCFTYEGYIYRAVAEDAEVVEHLRTRYHRAIEELGINPLVFVGLFDLSESERLFYKRLTQSRLAEFFWDDEVHVVSEEPLVGQDKALTYDPRLAHNAARIMRSNKKLLGGVQSSYHNNAEARRRGYLPKCVEVYKAASTVTQVKALSQIITSENLPKDITSAVVLPDEQLLIPVVSSIPDEYESLNITLGYPLNRTSVSTLINRWLRLLPTSYKGYYSVPNVVNLLSLQLLTEFYPGLITLCQALRRQKNYMLRGEWIVDVFLLHEAKRQEQRKQLERAEELLHARAILQILLKPTERATDFMAQLESLLDMIAQPMILRDARAAGVELEDEEHLDASTENFAISFDLNFLMHYQRLVRRLRGLIAAHGYDYLSREGAVRLLEGLSRSITIPFKGDPLEGFQIIGMLESRCLHFDTIIYMSAQEGCLPKGRHSSTFVPHMLRYAYKLPTPEYQEAVDSYLFYQTIAHSQKLIMLVAQEDSLGSKGEESRYISQMKLLYGLPVVYRPIEMPPRPLPVSEIRIAKDSDPRIAERLNAWLGEVGPLANGERPAALSASKLNDYLLCPLKFYYRHILDINEEDEAGELISESDFGTILHDTLAKSVYNVPAGSVIEAKYLEENYLKYGTERLSELVRKHYTEYFSQHSDGRLMTELDAYNIRLMATLMESILRYDLQRTPFVYLYSEAEVYHSIDISLSGQTSKVRFKGYIDRIDLSRDASQGDCINILDYKTGSDKMTSFKDVATLFGNVSDRKAILQTLLYCEMFREGQLRCNAQVQNKEHYARLPLRPGLYLARMMYGAVEGYKHSYRKDKSKGEWTNYDELRDEYLELLRSKLEELYDYSKDFVQTDKVKDCSYCSFALICRRQPRE